MTDSPDVSRETGDGRAGPPPAVASLLFPADRRELVQRYADLLATDGVVRGLIGPREVPRIWDRHLVNSALLAGALPRDCTVADIGSGAGLPGLVLALARPDVRVTLVEPLLRRTTFLEEAVATLGLDNVEVRRERADALHGAAAYDVVTARAVAPLERLLGWCMPLVAPTGALLAMKGDSAAQEIEAAAPVLRRLRCSPPAIETLTAPVGQEPGADETSAAAATENSSVEHSPPHTLVVRVTWADPTRVSWPASGGRGGSRPARTRSPRKQRRSS